MALSPTPPTMWVHRDGRHGARLRCRAITWARWSRIGSSRRVKATTQGGSNPISRLPSTTVVVTIRLIKTYAIANAALAIVSRGAIVTTNGHTPTDTEKQSGEQPTSRQLDPRRFHLTTSLLLAAGHSSRPNGAPAGSATTATSPPCLSG